MNTILNKVSGVETVGSAKQPQKTKGASTNEFRNMLSATINAEKPQASQKEVTSNQKKAAETGKSAKPVDEAQTTVKPGTPEETADKETTDEASQAIAAAMQVNISGNAHQPEAEMEPETEITDFLKIEAAQLNPVKLQTMAQQTASVQTTSVHVEPVDTVPVQAGSVETTPVQTNSVDTAPAQAGSVDKIPAQTDSADTVSVQADSVDKAPLQANPVNTAPAQETAVQTAEVLTNETQPVGTAQAQAPVTQTKAAQPEIQQKVEAMVAEEQVTVETQTTQPQAEQANVQQTGATAEQDAKPVKAATDGEVKADKPAEVTETAPEQVTVRQTGQPENQTKSQDKPVENRIEKPEHQAQAAKPENQEKTVQVSANTEQAAETVKHPQDAPRTRFDDMIAKASQELSQGEAVETEETADVKPVISTENPEEPETAAGTVKPEVPVKTGEKQESKPAAASASASAPAAVIKSEPSVPKSMQRTVREISGTDEATIGLIQPKQEIFTPETIKVQAEPAPAHPFRAPDQAEQIKAEVIRNIEDNKMEFNMQLNPKELGKIDVKMVLQGGSLSVEIVAANAQATELLAKQAESLIATLKSGNIEVSSVNVVHEAQNASSHMDGQFNLNNFQSRQQAHEQRGHTGRGGNGGNGAEPENAEAESETRSTPQGKLNYSI